MRYELKQNDHRQKDAEHPEQAFSDDVTFDFEDRLLCIFSHHSASNAVSDISCAASRRISFINIAGALNCLDQAVFALWGNFFAEVKHDRAH